MPMGHLRTDEGEVLPNEEKNRILLQTFFDRAWDKEWYSRNVTTARKLWDTERDLLHEDKV
jgi:hypothetical protein